MHHQDMFIVIGICLSSSSILDVFLTDYCLHSQWRFSICSNSIAIVGILWNDEQSPVASAIELYDENYMAVSVIMQLIPDRSNHYLDYLHRFHGKLTIQTFGSVGSYHG